MRTSSSAITTRRAALVEVGVAVGSVTGRRLTGPPPADGTRPSGRTSYAERRRCRCRLGVGPEEEVDLFALDPSAAQRRRRVASVEHRPLLAAMRPAHDP